MKSIVTRTVSIIGAALIAGATLFAATNVAAQEAVKPPESAKVLSLADFMKKLGVSNDSNVKGEKGIYLLNTRSKEFYSIHIEDGDVFYSGVGAGRNIDRAKIISKNTEQNTICFEFYTNTLGSACLRYFESDQDYYVERALTDYKDKITRIRFDQKPDPKTISLVK